MMLLRLATNEQKSLEYTIQFGSEDAVKTVEAIGKYLAVIYESMISGEQFREIPEVCVSGCYTSCVSGKLEIVDKVYDKPECNSWESNGSNTGQLYAELL
jgi:hypothetical protein